MEKVESQDRPSQLVALLGNTANLVTVYSGETVSVINGWRRGGSETYISDFVIDSQSSKRHLLAKACVKLCATETMREWLQRRSILAMHGVGTPDITAIDGAVIVEEYIPYSLREAYHEAGQKARDEIEKSFVNTFNVVNVLGFDTRGLHDVRSRGADVVLVDFDEDLGSQSSVQRDAPNGADKWLFDKMVSTR